MKYLLSLLVLFTTICSATASPAQSSTSRRVILRVMNSTDSLLTIDILCDADIESKKVTASAVLKPARVNLIPLPPFKHVCVVWPTGLTIRVDV